MTFQKMIYLMFFLLFYLMNTGSAQISENLTIIKSDLLQNNMTDQKEIIRVVQDHIFISKKNDLFDISEIVIFRNDGTEVYYSTENHTFFAISIPPDALGLKADVMECCIVTDEEVVFIDPMQPIKPGDNFEMKISYTLPSGSPEYVFSKTAMYNTTSLSIFISKKGGINVEGASRTLTLQGDKFDVFSFEDIKTGETINIPVHVIKNSHSFYSGILLLLLLSTGMIYFFRKRLISRKKESSLEELELEKKELFKTIYGFEKHAGGEQSDEYNRLIDEYKQKIINIFIKIDKIKQKDSLESFKRMDEKQTHLLKSN